MAKQDILKKFNSIFRIGKDGSLEMLYFDKETGKSEWLKPYKEHVEGFLSKALDTMRDEERKSIKKLMENGIFYEEKWMTHQEFLSKLKAKPKKSQTKE